MSEQTHIRACIHTYIHEFTYLLPYLLSHVYEHLYTEECLKNYPSLGYSVRKAPVPPSVSGHLPARPASNPWRLCPQPWLKQTTLSRQHPNRCVYCSMALTHTYIHIHIHTYVYICIHTHIHTYMDAHIYIYIDTVDDRNPARFYISKSTKTLGIMTTSYLEGHLRLISSTVCIHIYIYTYTHVYIHINVYIYVYTC